jgi:hypothetical protein
MPQPNITGPECRRINPVSSAHTDAHRSTRSRRFTVHDTAERVIDVRQRQAPANRRWAYNKRALWFARQHLLSAAAIERRKEPGAFGVVVAHVGCLDRARRRRVSKRRCVWCTP